MNKVSEESKEDILYAKYEELENLKKVIDKQMESLENNSSERTLKKINETKDFMEETDAKTAKKINKIKKLSNDERISKERADKAT